jgi:DHA2 family multidrug resistance protein-like MFS transporter
VATRREWVGLAVLGLPTLLVSIDIGALFLALPHLGADLGASSTQLLWITDIYGFLMAGFLITMGVLGDRVGRRKLLLVGATAFGVLSVVAAFSHSAAELITARALLGVAGATLMPSTLALISNMFRDDRQRGTAIAAWVSCMMTGAAIGPVIGGVLLNHFWWGSVFLVGVPVMVLLLATGPVLLPEFKNPNAGKLDPLSVVLSLAAILPMIYGIKQLALRGFEGLSLAALIFGVLVGALFVRRQLTLEHPLLDLRLFANRAFRSTLSAMLLAAGAMAGTFLLVSQYVQTVLNYSPLKAGILLIPTGLAIAVGAQLAPRLAKVMKPGTAITLGLLLGVVGFAMITQVHTTNSLALVIVGIAIVHLGAGPLFALGAFLVISSVPPERAGSAASMSETANTFGSTLGLAVLGTVGAAVYRNRVADTLPSGLTADQAKSAHDTLAGAADVATHASGSLGAAVAHSSDVAFTTGLNVVAVVGLLIFAGLAALITLAHKPSAQAPAPAPADEAEVATAAG